MEVNGSHCPEGINSTDCLLRTLLQFLSDSREADDEEINWDPLSFAFTVFIGLLAAAFAFMTILQAIFAAGKGRRKANERAIGRWSQDTVTQWRFSRMESQTIAYTPVLKFKLVWDALQNQVHPQNSKSTEERSRRSLREAVRRTLYKCSSFFKGPDNTPDASATWIGFLQEVGLEDIKLSTKTRRKIATDYLPDDLVAAPAFAQVGIIFTAAACAGALWFEDKESKYPTIVGPGFQFDLRTHPVLGTVGAYSRYGARSRLNIPSPEHLLIALRNGRGELDILRGLFAGHMEHTESQTIRGYVGLVGSFHSMFMVYGWFDYFWTHFERSQGFAVSPDLMENDFLPLLRLFQVSTPERTPSLLPVSRLKMSHPPSLLALNGNYWSNVHLTNFAKWEEFHFAGVPDFPPWTTFEIMMGQMRSLNEGPEFFDYLSDSGDKEEQDPTRDHQTKISATSVLEYLREFRLSRWIRSSSGSRGVVGDVRTEQHSGEEDELEILEYPNLQLHQRTIYLCILLLEKPAEFEKWFSSHPPHDRREMRSMILEQLKQIDKWLGYMEKTEERAAVIFNTTLSLCRAQEMQDAGSFKDSLNLKPDNETRGGKTARSRHEQLLQALSLISSSYHSETDTSSSRSEDGTVEASIDGKDIRRLAESLTGSHFPKKEEIDIPENKKRILNRLGSIVKNSGPPIKSGPVHDEEGHLRVLDDVIIYRCLLMGLLLYTAPDCSGLLLSGLWEQVIPII